MIKQYTDGAWVTVDKYKMYKSQEVESALPLTMLGDGEPLTDCKLYGNTVQNSIPTPSDPVYPSGAGTDNLFDINTVVLGKYIDANGVEQTSTGSEVNKLNHTDYIDILPNTGYTFTYSSTASPTINSVALCWYDSQKQLISRTTKNVSGNSYYINGTSPSTAVYCIINFIGYYETSVYQFNESGTTPPYYKIPITCGGQTTNIYLGSATSTRRVKKLVLTGGESENWSYVPSGGISRFRINLADAAAVTELKSTHYVYELANAYGNAFVNTTLTTLTICHSLTTVDAFKTFLQQQYANGTPVTVWYVLATPETAAVNEPLMKIGDYADEISVTGLPTIDGVTVYDCDLEVKPSKMEAEADARWLPYTPKKYTNGEWR